jgi:uncharacterized lipoprotein YddW (UPF0748 family)
LLFFLLAAAAVRAAVSYTPSNITPPSLAREFRGAWVATVNNIDWPSKPGLSTAEQQAELLLIFRRAEQLKLNAILLQVRPACDALYASKCEPWSEYLTGEQGRTPQPFWDPLEFAIREAHQRGMELHAWINPFRARHGSASSAPARDHISKSRPALAREYGRSVWLDPGLAEVHDHSMRVILDIVKRYDVDGVHIDDYFYPYREKDRAGSLIPFPDDASWAAYQRGGGKLARDDWRRDNVNRFIARMYREVKAARPWVKVGISPFGIYRPGHPEQIRGLDQFESLYADPRAWLAGGWLDYLAPQLYWRIEPPAQSFPVLLNWWTENNPKRRLIVAGMNTASVGGRTAWPASEITAQIDITRKQSGASGHIHWNMSALAKNKGGVAGELARASYVQPALMPAIAASEGTVPRPKVTARAVKNGTRFSWTASAGDPVRWWVVQSRREGKWQAQVLPADSRAIEVPAPPPDVFAVRGQDRFGKVGEPAVLAAGGN